jgi:hypothetical protein
MAIKVYLSNPQSDQVLDCGPGFTGRCTLVAESLVRLDSKWQSGINNAAETVNVVTPDTNGSIFITDILVTSSKKVANSTIILQFYDGTNTEKIMEIEGVSAPVEFSHAFAGGLSGWKGAALQVITDQIAMYVVTLVGYIKVSKDLTKTYSEWNADR